MHTWILRVFKPTAAPRWPATRPSMKHTRTCSFRTKVSWDAVFRSIVFTVRRWTQNLWFVVRKSTENWCWYLQLQRHRERGLGSLGFQCGECSRETGGLMSPATAETQDSGFPGRRECVCRTCFQNNKLTLFIISKFMVSRPLTPAIFPPLCHSWRSPCVCFPSALRGETVRSNSRSRRQPKHTTESVDSKLCSEIWIPPWRIPLETSRVTTVAKKRRLWVGSGSCAAWRTRFRCWSCLRVECGSSRVQQTGTPSPSPSSDLCGSTRQVCRRKSLVDLLHASVCPHVCLHRTSSCRTLSWYHKHTGWYLRRDCPRRREPPYLLTSFQSNHQVSGGSHIWGWCVTPHSSGPWQGVLAVSNNF